MLVPTSVYGPLLILLVVAALSAVIGCERTSRGYWRLRVEQMPFIFFGAWGLLLIETVSYVWGYLSSKFPQVNEACFDVIPCIGFAIGYGALLLLPKGWFNEFASPLVPLFISASSIRKFVTSLNQPLNKLSDSLAGATPRQAIINLIKTMLKFALFQFPAILYLAFFTSSPLAELWVHILAIACFLLGGSISFFSIGISIWPLRTRLFHKP